MGKASYHVKQTFKFATSNFFKFLQLVHFPTWCTSSSKLHPNFIDSSLRYRCVQVRVRLLWYVFTPSHLCIYWTSSSSSSIIHSHNSHSTENELRLLGHIVIWRIFWESMTLQVSSAHVLCLSLQINKSRLNQVGLFKDVGRPDLDLIWLRIICTCSKTKQMPWILLRRENSHWRCL